MQTQQCQDLGTRNFGLRCCVQLRFNWWKHHEVVAKPLLAVAPFLARSLS